MHTVPFKQVDVFTRVPLRGNPVAVVFGADGLDSLNMQLLAAWTNLSETVFVLPPTLPGADYRLRIFTPRQELPFAGHPSIGAAHAILEARWATLHDGQLTQECEAGLLRVRVTEDAEGVQIYVRVPSAQVDPLEAASEQRLAEALGLVAHLSGGEKPRRSSEPRGPRPRSQSGVLSGSLVNVGPQWLVADLDKEDAVRSLRPHFGLLAALCDELGAVGINVFGRAENNDGLVVRSFAPSDGILEDPVCGSGNAAVAAHLFDRRGLDKIGHRYRVSQGREVGRDGTVLVEIDADGAIDIGGAAITCVDGTLHI